MSLFRSSFPATLAMLILTPLLNAQTGKTWVSEKDIASVRADLDSTFDRFTGTSRIGPKKPKPLAGGGGLISTDLYFAVVRNVPKDGSPSFYARVYYQGLGWAFLNGTVQFLIDGKDQVEITGPSSEAERGVTRICTGGRGCLVTEGERIPMSDSLVAQLARAHSIEVRANGTKASLERWFKKDHHAELRLLARRYSIIP
jgi:hypothetical protein